jgi:hypothetical protein
MSDESGVLELSRGHTIGQKTAGVLGTLRSTPRSYSKPVNQLKENQLLILPILPINTIHLTLFDNRFPNVLKNCE